MKELTSYLVAAGDRPGGLEIVLILEVLMFS
jgi:hypothetical protein